MAQITDIMIKIIKNHPNGISIKELSHVCEPKLPKRTLQYQLSALVKNGILRKIGSGRNTKYTIKETVVGIAIEVEPDNFVVPLSKEAKEVQKKISAPIELRPHVSYRRDFLDSYEPNKTFYLSKPILEKLSKLGGGERELPAGTYARRIYQRLLIDLSWNSSRLEGNTYSLLETEKLLSAGEEAEGKDRIDTQMILNHKEAIEFIIDMVEEIGINRSTILNIHGLLSHDLLLDPKACGRLRMIPVEIGKSVYLPLEIPQLIEEYFQILIQKAAIIKNPFEQSFFLMVHIAYLQPFLDVNKSVARLVGNIPFIRSNLSPLSFVDVPKTDYTQGLLAIYELNRIELFRDVFIWAYERSASLYLATLEAIGLPDPFKVRYRDLIRQVVLGAVQGKMNKLKTSQFISDFTKEKLPPGDQNRFIQIVEIEMNSLHEGNFARFRIRPSEFYEWQKNWG